MSTPTAEEWVRPCYHDVVDKSKTRKNWRLVKAGFVLKAFKVPRAFPKTSQTARSNGCNQEGWGSNVLSRGITKHPNSITLTCRKKLSFCHTWTGARSELEDTIPKISVEAGFGLGLFSRHRR